MNFNFWNCLRALDGVDSTPSNRWGGIPPIQDGAAREWERVEERGEGAVPQRSGECRSSLHCDPQPACLAGLACQPLLPHSSPSLILLSKSLLLLLLLLLLLPLLLLLLRRRRRRRRGESPLLCLWRAVLALSALPRSVAILAQTMFEPSDAPHML